MGKATFKRVNYIPKNDRDFGMTVRKRVNEYFKNNKIDRTGDYRIWIKVAILPLLLIVPFGLILTNQFSNNLAIFYGLWVMMGIGLAGAGTGIMHDACHGALSKNKKVNKIIGEFVWILAGGSALNWKIQHNVLHHTYTNVSGFDEDIDPSGIMRFTPEQPVKSFHKYQAYYAWFVYGLMTLQWATYKVFVQLKRFNDMGLVKAQGADYKKELRKMIIYKVFYYSFYIVMPLLLLDVAWYHVVLGWLSMQYFAGLFLALIFQPAHVVPSTEFPVPDGENNVEGDWSKLQLLTTANFAPDNKLLSWYIGGLNFQIEHHLFLDVCHVHHKKLSKIVKKTAEEFGLPYYSKPTYIGALVSHFKMLHSLRK